MATRASNPSTDRTQAPQQASPAYPRRWAAAIVMMVAALMDLVDGTIVNIALPTIRRDLHASGTALEWMASAYLLAFAVALITAGRVGDLVGRKRMFLAGVAGFGLASLAAGFAASSGELIAFRAVQGVAAAVMVPQVLATFRSIFEGKERGAAFGLYGAMGGAAAALGVLLGGVLVSANLFGWGWRAVFAVNVPIALAAGLAAVALVPETKAESSPRPDLPGMAWLSAGVLAIAYPLVEGRSLGWPAWSFALLGAGAAAVAGLGVVQARRQRTGLGAGSGGVLQAGGPALRLPAPLLPASLLRNPAFAAGLAVQFVFFAGMMGYALVGTMWLQAGQHYSPLRTGLTMVAFTVGAFLTAPPAVALAARLGRYILAIGALMMAGGMYCVLVAVTHSSHGVSPWQLVPGFVIAGAGLGFLVVPLANVVLAAVPKDLAGGASGIFSTAQMLGGAMGVAVLGTVFFPRAASAGFTSATELAIPFVIGGYLCCAGLTLLLPRTAVAEAFE